MKKILLLLTPLCLLTLPVTSRVARANVHLADDCGVLGLHL